MTNLFYTALHRVIEDADGRLTAGIENARADILASNDDSAPTYPFWVRTAVGSQFFPVMGRDRVSVQRAHEGNCLPGEQCVVLDEEEYDARTDRQYMQNAAEYRRRRELGAHWDQQRELENSGRVL